ncbi:flagellar hook-basal body complex protein [Butyrivibrio sp. INlla14]|uniref:flagellar hook-basal body complex protein n=1 Tax=Butyrivibrio sp. INlla14 TaxID=1520808 RepID=UPI00087620C4|nr:flagellar hook-basal body complex protein [Butyrivibrio sp. INlla14]SCY58583.1 flagellar hook protein FlgE [Butyrivibrio sp. INlla14]
MMRSLYSGVAGLRTHQTKMDVLGNNIANVNTTSFKSQSITFSDLMYQTTQTASGATETKGGVNARQIGLGAKSGAIATAIEGQGATQTTNNPFDIMITGKAFFVVNNGKENLYTRDGSFYVDGAGNLAMQSNGYFVMGWVAQEDPETGAITVNKNGGLSQLQIMSADNTTYSPASTTQALYSGNLDDNDSNIVSDDGKTVTLEFYDNKGYLYTAKFTIKDTEDPNDHLFSVQLTDIIDSDGNSIGSERLAGVQFGDIQDFEKLVNEEGDYQVEMGTKSSKVYQKAGTALFNGAVVPSGGEGYELTLGDINNATSNKNPYKGLLQTVYGKDDDWITSTDGVSKNSAVRIDPSTGGLIVTKSFTETKEYATNYSFSPKNIYSYYVNEDTKFGYRVIPTTEAGTYGDGKDLKDYTETLKNVYGIDEANIEKYIDQSQKYTYTLTEATNGVSTLNIYPHISDLDKGENIKNKSASEILSVGSGKFSGNFDTALAAATGDVRYTFDGHSLKVEELQETGTFDPSETSQREEISYVEAALAEITTSILYMTTATGGGSLKSEYTIAELNTLLDKYVNEGGGTTTDTYYQTVQSMLNTVTDNGTNDVSKIEIVGISGSEAIITFGPKPLTEYKTIYEGNVKAVEDSKTDDSYASQKKAADAYPYAIVNSNKTAYLLENSEGNLEDLPEELLTNCFGVTKSEYEAKGFDYSYKINASGLYLSHNEEETLEIVKDETTNTPKYQAVPNDDSTGYTFVSTQKIQAYNNTEVPNEGNIVDLLSTSSKAYAGFLKDAYGITDSDARAYGADGKYKIVSDDTIVLSTGEKTVQLKFDAATGKIISAGGNKDTQKVSMKFANNKTDSGFVTGNEAFGFQVKNANDADELAKLGTIEVDFSTVTNYNTNGSSTIKAVKGDKSSLNTGRAVGEMNGVTVSTDGTIYATYSNGQTKLLGQIASAEFANASGLSKEGDNLYASTLNSGEATIQDITTDGGYMNTGVLEMSNVDLSKEFTEMITTQRGFQANSRIITVSDTLLEELTNLKR